ncbi:LacI family DNA-binding transcriptional regulator [Sphingomonas sabuli]|uniref:LacI family DNA-binding transcriptional regulator n=1 Tax=Sphingomonas sabuli TaxID=2764186 RepID=A0A7G9KZS8_9SPHN|nr:LacI family DNA-binding transcriptional regulator [Sphingomonas sabuli]QNM81877.1 LacI family DNA-binding transcriptional regulator [Sphingomonas sabuli]
MRRPTSFDIAALAGVSQPTVSRALNNNPSVSESTRARVLAAAEQLNYKVDKNASALRRQQSQTLALLFFEEEGTATGAHINPFYLSMVGPMVRRCADRGYDLLISFQQLSSDWHVDFEDSRKADGIVLLGYGDYLKYRPRLEELVERNTHFVRWGSVESQLGTTVSSNNEQGGFEAVSHLLEEGNRNIAFVGTVSPAYPEFLDRWRGYCRALWTAGLVPDKQMQVEAAPTEEDGRKAVEELTRRGCTFDAIFATSDLAAIGAMHALQIAGRAIPDDVAVVGFDDIDSAQLTSPPLTSIRQNARVAGEALIETLLEAVEHGSAEDRLLPVQLIVRQSSVRRR